MDYDALPIRDGSHIVVGDWIGTLVACGRDTGQVNLASDADALCHSPHSAFGVSVAMWFIRRSRKKDGNPQPGGMVIGTELAAAQSAENARLASDALQPSPLADCQYRVVDGGGDLRTPRRLPLDDKLAEFCHRFTAADVATRLRICRSISMDDCYTLLQFAERSAVFAMRERSIVFATDGLQAVAAIECSRIDYRDALVTLALLHTAATNIGENADDLITAIATMAEPGTRELMTSFSNRPLASKTARCMGFTVWETEAGPGFISWDNRTYAPTVPLDKMALAISNLLASDQYDSSYTLASGLPHAWLTGIDDDAFTRALQSIVAGATINGTLRKEAHSDFMHQQMTIFLVETAGASDVDSLDKLARAKFAQKRDFNMLAIRHDRLFVLVIARSFVQGKAPFETQQDLERFRAGIMVALQAN